MSRFGRVGVPAAVLVVAATAWLSGQGRPAFRSAVEVVSLNITVTDPESRYVTDLDRGDFSVFEDGIQQEITFFNRANLPIALALLVDTSASMEDKLTTAQNAAIGFARSLRPQDFASVIDFDSRVEVKQAFTNDPALLETAIRNTSAGGSTALFNALYISLRELTKRKAASSDDVRRQAVVLLSDGEDTNSLMTFEEVLELAKRSETAIYAIGIKGRDVSTSRGFKEAEFVLRQLAQETGGRAFFPAAAQELVGIYEQIALELSSQYTVGYTSKNSRRDGQWRRVVVRLSRPNVVARTKQGYYASGLQAER